MQLGAGWEVAFTPEADVPGSKPTGERRDRGEGTEGAHESSWGHITLGQLFSVIQS